ncbi:SCP2 sterol-binding domain-containing protein [Maricurvus nonylphenolicus]|uniref:SCP2 sterol-binding domain-containing protein n=1 Tax=Maricurvus nonylphenolicus TaxID=1008307 RepID=UPI0036F228BF
MTVDDLIAKLNESFNPAAAAGMDEVFQYHFKGDESFYIVIKDNEHEIVKGEHAEPSVTFTTSVATFIGVADGSINGMAAFVTGKLRFKGNKTLAQKMETLFPLSF